jgi:hypothetical protein
MEMHHALIDPSDPLGLAIVVLGTISTAWSFVLAFRMTLWPGEHDPDHPKYEIFREDR